MPGLGCEDGKGGDGGAEAAGAVVWFEYVLTTVATLASRFMGLPAMAGFSKRCGPERGAAEAESEADAAGPDEKGAIVGASQWNFPMEVFGSGDGFASLPCLFSIVLIPRS
jgi:hypothetical protein